MFQAFGLFSVHWRRPRSQGVSHRVAIPAAKSQRGYGIRGPTRTLLSGTYTFDTSFAGPDTASPCQSQDLGCPAITKSADRPFRARNLPGNQIAASRIGSVGGLLESATYAEGLGIEGAQVRSESLADQRLYPCTARIFWPYFSSVLWVLGIVMTVIAGAGERAGIDIV